MFELRPPPPGFSLKLQTVSLSEEGASSSMVQKTYIAHKISVRRKKVANKKKIHIKKKCKSSGTLVCKPCVNLDMTTTLIWN